MTRSRHSAEGTPIRLLPCVEGTPIRSLPCVQGKVGEG
jgi:hypothetical protein